MCVLVADQPCHYNDSIQNYGRVHMFSINNTKVIFVILGLGLAMTITSCADRASLEVSYAVQDELKESRIFAEGVVSTNREQNLSFTPDGKTIFFERASNGRGTLYASDFVDGKWAQPYIPGFAIDGQSEGNAFVSPDGTKVYFTSTRPHAGSAAGGYDIWYAERSEGGWSEAIHVGMPLNSQYGETYPAVAANGNLYFNSARPDSDGRIAVYMSEFKDGGYSKPTLLGEAINKGQTHSLTPYIAPDESYLIFCLVLNDSDADLYISYNQDGQWLPAEPLSPAVNRIGSIETTPSMSPDGKYFFFSRLNGTGENGGTIYQIEAVHAGISSEGRNRT
jgi:Tol biopolymer transport system component